MRYTEVLGSIPNMSTVSFCSFFARHGYETNSWVTSFCSRWCRASIVLKIIEIRGLSRELWHFKVGTPRDKFFLPSFLLTQRALWGSKVEVGFHFVYNMTSAQRWVRIRSRVPKGMTERKVWPDALVAMTIISPWQFLFFLLLISTNFCSSS